MKWRAAVLVGLFFSYAVYANEYLYNYRYGTESPYGYNYDVSGLDEDGDRVSGNIDIEGKYGSGTIEKSDGEEVEVDIEWNGYGELLAEDAEGNSYYMSVE
ncbi:MULTISPECIES: hypothetical protein [Providencia]|uniref:hypothetical protein n=1 Tax=Providencia TaxID=586 RepID=UPI000F7AFDC0|nr:hypothetical protein [Providencia rettgeri]MBV2190592.1 hypothetical protein [Providencia rettgeri]HEC8322372.1 hypothetical protein [Providencia rettgeri]